MHFPALARSFTVPIETVGVVVAAGVVLWILLAAMDLANGVRGIIATIRRWWRGKR